MLICNVRKHNIHPPVSIILEKRGKTYNYSPQIPHLKEIIICQKIALTVKSWMHFPSMKPIWSAACSEKDENFLANQQAKHMMTISSFVHIRPKMNASTKLDINLINTLLRNSCEFGKPFLWPTPALSSISICNLLNKDEQWTWHRYLYNNEKLHSLNMYIIKGTTNNETLFSYLLTLHYFKIFTCSSIWMTTPNFMIHTNKVIYIRI